MSSGEPGGRGVAALHLQDVGAVEAGGAHADEDLARLRGGIGVLFDDDGAVADGHGSHGRERYRRRADPRRSRPKRPICADN